MQHVKKIDYEKITMTTKTDEIHCWTGGETCKVCRIIVADTVKIPLGVHFHRNSVFSNPLHQRECRVGKPDFHSLWLA